MLRASTYSIGTLGQQTQLSESNHRNQARRAQAYLLARTATVTLSLAGLLQRYTNAVARP
jgi:hypothetical protein